jgi:nucleoid-associated protein YgaU
MAPSDASLAQGAAKAPTVLFGWGTNIIMEQAYLKTMSITYKRFMLGNPVRAEVTVGLEAVPSIVPGTNPTSGGLTTRRTHTVIQGDTLASIAQSEYGDPAKWRAVAVANGIDDPMRVGVGTVLMVPDPREAEDLV